MELKKEVCSLESAIKLEKLGVPQRSLFYWSSTKGKNDFDCYYQNDQGALDEQVCGPLDTYSAFTVAELGELLPAEIIIDHARCSIHMNRSGGSQEYHMVSYLTISHLSNHQRACEVSLNEAEARAKMLIYLLENKLI